MDCAVSVGCGAAVGGACAAGWEVGACVAAIAAAGAACSDHVKQCGARRLSTTKREMKKLPKKDNRRKLNWVDCVKTAGCTAAVAAACTAGWEGGACVAAIAAAGAGCKSSVEQCGKRRLSTLKRDLKKAHKKSKKDLKKKRDLSLMDCAVSVGCGAAVGGACAAGWEVGACVAAIAAAGAACSDHVKQCGARRLSTTKREMKKLPKKDNRRKLNWVDCVKTAGCTAAVAAAC